MSEDKKRIKELEKKIKKLERMIDDILWRYDPEGEDGWDGPEHNSK